MTDSEILQAIEHHNLAVLGPTGTKSRPGTEWVARSGDSTLLGFGTTPGAAVEDALRKGKKSSGGD